MSNLLPDCIPAGDQLIFYSNDATHRVQEHQMQHLPSGTLGIAVSIPPSRVLESDSGRLSRTVKRYPGRDTFRKVIRHKSLALSDIVVLNPHFNVIFLESQSEMNKNE